MWLLMLVDLLYGALLNVIPTWISNGLQITMGLLPAIGFGLLLMMIMEKRRCMFLLLRIRIKRILKDSSNSDRNLWSHHCYRINSVT